MSNAKIEINAQGGKGSVTKGGFDVGFPFEGAMIVSGVVKGGSVRYAVNNWRLCPPEEHYRHALEHLMFVGFQAGETPDGETRKEHIAHAACRLLMLLSVMPDDYRFKWQNIPYPTPDTQQASGNMQACMGTALAAKIPTRLPGIGGLRPVNQPDPDPGFLLH